MNQAGVFVFDVETSGLAKTSSFLGLSFLKCADYTDTPVFLTCFREARLELLKSFLRGDRVVGHNIATFDLPWLIWHERTHYGTDLILTVARNKSHLIYDTLIMSRKFNPNRMKHGLKEWGEVLARDYSLAPKPEIKDFTKATPEEIKDRCNTDVQIQAALWHHFTTEKGMPDTVPDYEFDQRWFKVVLELCTTGIPYDTAQARKTSLRNGMLKVIPKDRLKKRFPKVNFNSSRQVDKALIEKYGTGLPINDKGNPVLNVDVRDEVCNTFPELYDHFKIKDIDAGLKYISEEYKGKKSYMGGYLEESPYLEQECVYPSLTVVGTRTGRMQYSSPPLQQMAKEVREVNRVRPPWIFYGMDVVALEMSVLGYFMKELCGDDTIWQQVKRGESAKKLTLEAFKPVMHNVVYHGGQTPEDFAKTLNYSLLYGIGKRALLAKLNLPAEYTAEVDKCINQRFPSMHMLNRIFKGRYKGRVIIDMFGGKIPTEDWKALNAFIQASGATYARRMMYHAWRYIRDVGKCHSMEVRACVYNMDELQFVIKNYRDVPELSQKNVNTYIEKELEKEDLPVLTGVEIKTGNCWKDTH